MTKTLLIITALVLGGTASGQSLKPGAPDSTILDLGVTAAPEFSLSYRPTLNLYGNITLQERLLTTPTGNLWGTLTLGNTYNDFTRLFAEGRLDYQVKNITVYISSP
jgi:hypothetical protein